MGYFYDGNDDDDDDDDDDGGGGGGSGDDDEEEGEGEGREEEGDGGWWWLNRTLRRRRIQDEGDLRERAPLPSFFLLFMSCCAQRLTRGLNQYRETIVLTTYRH
ncbi:hypothetical protein TWF730_010748 [Orbilia blumenaviensis]|uniref:Uncharacterized protein n=1 Tax=Orbilia blumenaviensis TaxID=1796055 RepID=A0AAV9URQ5_9PEZI